ncbi:MAG TPA: hypothetical protein VFC46_08580 [Humisphaera sp.]|nr:hypothetical protein [Humisphaera sp.]
MLTDFPKARSIAREFFEKMARIFIGEPARIVRKSTLDRLERLAYREQLRRAAAVGDSDYIEQEIRKNQLTPSEMARLGRRSTPIEEWPELSDDVMALTLFDEKREGSQSARGVD